MPPLLPDPCRLHLTLLRAENDRITMVAASNATSAACPLCYQPSTRIHSRYCRTLADLPWHGIAVRLQLTVHRFVCGTTTCKRRIFAEPIPSIAARYARRTTRLTDAFELIGFALGGEAGARLLAGLAMTGSPDTLLRTIRAAALPRSVTPRVLGVDDFAYRRGRRYGTLLIDLERHCRVDLLADRTAESLAAWLKDHPGVEIISRDRGGAYADGARRGAPEAVQVADRFHVLCNLRQTLERLLLRRYACLTRAAAVLSTSVVHEAVDEGETPPEPTTRAERQARARRARRVARYEEVRRLRSEGKSLRVIRRHTGLALGTVRRFAASETFPERAPRAPYPSISDPYEPYLRRRWEEGCHNATQLWREVREQGFTGSRSAFKDRLSRWRTEPASTGRPRTSRSPPLSAATVQPRSPRQASWLLVRSSSELDTEDQAYLAQLRATSSDIETVYPLAQEFQRLVRERDHPALERWLIAAEASELPELTGFAAGIRRDRAAVDQMLLTDWSNGQLEGQVNRLKLVKRQMFGRAKFDLLRQRVLHHA